MKKRGNKKSESSSNLRKALIPFFLITIALLIIFFALDFDIGLTPPIHHNYFAGLPNSFAPTVGYSHEMGGGRISLWDASGTAFVGDGNSFTEFTPADKASYGLPADFIPTTGYYYPVSGVADTGYIQLTNEDNLYNMRTRALGFTKVQGFLSTYDSFFPPRVTYFHGFNKGIRGEFNADGDLYFVPISNPTYGKVIPVAGLGDFDLPTNKPPATGYYFRFSDCPYTGPIGDIDNDGDVDQDDIGGILDSTNGCGDLDNNGVVDNIDKNIAQKIKDEDYETANANIRPIFAGVHLWYSLAGVAHIYHWDGTGKFKRRSSLYIGDTMNLPIDQTPTIGYYDKFLNKVVLWYGTEVYTSSDGVSFTKVYNTIVAPGPTPRCSITNLCTTPEICSASGICVACTQDNLLNCGTEDICSASGICTPPETQCTIPADCPEVGSTCDAQGACVPPITECTILPSADPKSPASTTSSCDAGQICVEGVCEDAPDGSCTIDSQCGATEVCLGTVCVPGDLCIDSDSEEDFIGIDPTVKGTVAYANGTIAGRDECSVDDELTEYYCNEENLKDSVVITCLGYCSSGTCVDEPEAECLETDARRDYDVQGKVTLKLDEEEIVEFEDECLTSKKLLEYMCNNDDRIEMVKRTCTSSERCSEGACVSRTGGTGGTGDTSRTGGTCINGQERCDGNNLEICTSGVWRDVGKQDGKCNYDATDEDPDEFTCSRDSQCDEGESCNSGGSCQREKSSAGLWVTIIVIAILIVFIIGAIIFVTIKNKNKEQNRKSHVTMTPKRPPSSGTTNQRRQPRRT